MITQHSIEKILRDYELSIDWSKGWQIYRELLSFGLLEPNPKDVLAFIDDFLYWEHLHLKLVLFTACYPDAIRNNVKNNFKKKYLRRYASVEQLASMKIDVDDVAKKRLLKKAITHLTEAQNYNSDMPISPFDAFDLAFSHYKLFELSKHKSLIDSALELVLTAERGMNRVNRNQNLFKTRIAMLKAQICISLASYDPSYIVLAGEGLANIDHTELFPNNKVRLELLIGDYYFKLFDIFNEPEDLVAAIKHYENANVLVNIQAESLLEQTLAKLERAHKLYSNIIL